MTKVNVDEIVTNKILAQLDQGVIPWTKPWVGTNKNAAYNRFTGKPYSLLNQLLLDKPGEWATLKQWSSIGGTVKKGEKSSIVTFWNMVEIDEKDKNGNITQKTIPLLRYYNVFHISQVDNVAPKTKKETTLFNTNNTVIENCEEVVKGYVLEEQTTTNPNFNIFVDEGGNRAFYSVTQDNITVPNIKQFKSSEAYYDTVFHEMIHSTGAKTRLNRPEVAEANGLKHSKDYAREELVAEIGAMMLNQACGISTDDIDANNVAYINSWRAKLEQDNKLIISATSRAEKAFNYVLKNITENADIVA